MGLKYNDFALRGVDVSEHQGLINWQLIEKNADYVSIRVGYGNTIDKRFIANITEAVKTKLKIYVYFYSDYYSNWFNKASIAYGLSDVDWGIRQAKNLLSWIKPWMDRIKIVFLDVENITDPTFPKLSDPIANPHAQRINQAFLKYLDDLEIRNGIYTSVGWLSWFWDWFRTKPLWAAFYPYRTANVEVSDLRYIVQKNGWKVAPIIWQFAQDGDQDDNGTGDGISYFGTSSKSLDLNGWVGNADQYEDLFGTPVIVLPEIPENTAGVYLVKASPYLFIRSGRSATTSKVGLYYYGAKVRLATIIGDWGLVVGQDNHFIYLGYTQKIK